MTLNGYDLNEVIVFIGIICTSGIGVYNTGKKILSMLETYRQKRNKIENRETYIDNKFTEIDQKIVENKEDITNLKANVDKLDNEMSTILSNVTMTNKVTSRNQLLQYAKEILAKQWMTQSECDTLNDLCDAFTRSSDNPNNVNLPNVVQRAMELPVLTQEEIEARNYANSNRRPSLTENIKEDINNFNQKLKRK